MGFLRALMNYLKGPLLVSAVLGGLVACEQAPSYQSQGACETANTNTYQLEGQWKRIRYEPPRSEAELEYNYDLLIFDGKTNAQRICEASILNRRKPLSPNWYGNYSADLKTQKLNITATTPDTGDIYDLSYDFRFSGECGETRLTLTSTDGQSEVYEIYSQEVAEKACPNFVDPGAGDEDDKSDTP